MDLRDTLFRLSTPPSSRSTGSSLRSTTEPNWGLGSLDCVDTNKYVSRCSFPSARSTHISSFPQDLLERLPFVTNATGYINANFAAPITSRACQSGLRIQP